MNERKCCPEELIETKIQPLNKKKRNHCYNVGNDMNNISRECNNNNRESRKRHRLCHFNVQSNMKSNFRPRRIVNFVEDSKNLVYYDKLSKSDRQSLWYTPLDIKSFRLNIVKIISIVKKHQNISPLIRKQFSIRGLEKYIIPKDQRNRRHSFIQSIVQMHSNQNRQLRQETSNYFSTFDYQQFQQQKQQYEHLFTAYSSDFSYEHRIQARNRAIKDEIFVVKQLLKVK